MNKKPRSVPWLFSCKAMGMPVSYISLFSILLLLGIGCQTNPEIPKPPVALQVPSIYVLGTLQDGGAPHIGCNRPCCRNLFLRPAQDRQVVCLGVTDTDALGETVGAMLEATPDFTKQLNAFQTWANLPLSGIQVLLTHAHIGHYSGLMYLGREALGGDSIPVKVMPRFREFLETNGPWDQLVSLGNIKLLEMAADEPSPLGDQVSITPLLVPHRDEYSETVGFRVQGPRRAALFIPDINKWAAWERSLESELALVDRAYLDATFYDAAEVGHRDMAEIPHPFMVETMELLKNAPASERNKVHFIHLNHTNPCLDSTSEAYQIVVHNGFHVARAGDVFEL